jgi:hypothetical protein
MLFFQADAIVYPIWRVLAPAEAELVRCLCVDIPTDELFELEVILTAVQEERPDELEGALQDPTTYAPTREEVRTWSARRIA